MKTNGLKDFKPIPLYMLNDVVVKEEVDRQMALMKECGISAFFIHARDGLIDRGYGNKKWYDDIAYIMEKGEEYGLTVYLYDEDAYPSGNLGGKIALDHPEFIARELFVQRVDVVDGAAKVLLGNSRPLRAYEVKKDGTVKDLTDGFGVTRTDFYSLTKNYAYNGYTDVLPHRRSATYHPQCIFYAEDVEEGSEVFVAYAALCTRINRYGCLADLLNKECVDYYKEYAYKKQADVIPTRVRERQNTLIFTDEPISGGMLPWTEKIEEVFFKEKGYSITDNYYRLILEDDFSRVVRKDYWQIASKMFTENFIKNLRDCCKENGLEFMGHLENEENLYIQAIKGVNVYESMWEFDHPGFDAIYVKTSSRDDYRQVFGAKVATSVAHQRGSERVFCEMFGITPYNFGLDGMKRYCGWTFIMGANTAVPHGFYYGSAGYRKYDAGKSFFFQDPDFKDFPKFSQFTDAYGRLLSAHKPTAKTLLVEPNWEFAALSEDGCAKLNEKLLMAVKALTEAHIEFDITDCNYVEKHFGEGKAVVGIKTYDNVVYVNGGSSVMNPIYERLQKTDVELFVFENEESFDIQRLKGLSVTTEFIGILGDDKDILTFRKTADDGDCIFLFNNTAEPTRVKVKTDGDGALYDLEKDGWLLVNSTDGYCELSMEGYAFHALKISSSVETLGEYVPATYEKKILPHEEDEQWTYLPPVDVKAVVKNYDLTVCHKGEETVLKNVRAGQLYELYAGDNRRILIDALNDATVIKDNYPVNATFTASFSADSATRMLFETETFVGNARIFLNGTEIQKGDIQSVNVYDFKNLEVDVSKLIKTGNNVLEVVFTGGTEKDGIIGEIYFY
jgi:hypothetical protein